MTEAGATLIEAAEEAVAIAKGEQPAARIHHNGFAYVPEERWQPIETAPKDGSLLLAAKESGLPWAKWLSTTRFPYPLRQRWSAIKGAWEADDGHVYEPQPSHWQPLPSPPVAEETK